MDRAEANARPGAVRSDHVLELLGYRDSGSHGRGIQELGDAVKAEAK